MIMPSKFITTDQSVLGKAVCIVEIMKSSKNVVEAFHHASKDGMSIDDFILCLDLLWVIDLIDVDLLTGEFDNAS